MSVRAPILVSVLLMALLADAGAFAQGSAEPIPTAAKEPAAQSETAPVNAAPAADDEPAAPSDADKEEARRQFEKGLELLQEQAWSAALAAFLRSRELYPTRGNTNNAAVCLRKLQRYDESLDMFETLLREFPTLPSEDKEAAQRNMAELRELVGTIDVTGAVPGAAITVDGQTRGDFPPITPIRAPAGSHIVRVYKEGYEPFQVRIDVAGGQNAPVVAKLRPLKDSGKLKVVEQSGRSLDVLIDGTPRGQTPWEGKLELGPHMVVLRGRGITGTQPASVVIQSQKTKTLTLRAEDLDAAIRVEPRPISARVVLDGVTLGSGPWALRLKSGSHKVEVFEDGFLSETRNVNLGRGDRQVISVDLSRDLNAARWKKPSKWLLEARAGFAGTPSFGGDVVDSCAEGCSRSFGAGALVVAHGGYELGWGLGLGIEAGYLTVFQSLEGRNTILMPNGLSQSPRNGTAEDSLRLDGLVAGASVSYRFGERLPVGIRLGAGALIGRVRDERSGAYMARDGTGIDAYAVESRPGAIFGYAAPELYLGVRMKKQFEIGASLAALLLFAPSQPRWDTLVETSAGTDGQGTYADDTLSGAFIFSIVPAIRVRYEL